jgi:hypothetical protein
MVRPCWMPFTGRSQRECFVGRMSLTQDEIGKAKVISIIERDLPNDLPESSSAEATATRLGLPKYAEGLIDWDIFGAILEPTKLPLLLSWRHATAADESEQGLFRQMRACGA